MNRALSSFFLFALLALTSAGSHPKAQDPMTTVKTEVEGYIYAAGILLFAVGSLFLLFGLKLFRVIIFMSGFFSFAIPTFLMMGGAALANNGSNAGGQLVLDFFIAIVFGIAGGYIALCCQKLSVFLVGFACGGAILFLLTAILFNMSSSAAGPATILGLIGGIVGGILAIKIFDQVIIILTSFAGSAMIINAINLFISGINLFEGFQKFALEYAALTLILAVVGVLYQNKTKPPKDKDGKLITSPELMLVNVNYAPPVTNNQINNYMTVPNISTTGMMSVNGMTDQQQAYYNP